MEALALYEQGRYAEAADKISGLVSHNQVGRNELQPYGKAIALLARAYANQGKLTEALEWCEKAIVADKLNPGFYYLCATILQEQGQVEEAVKSLKQALYLDRILWLLILRWEISLCDKGSLKNQTSISRMFSCF